MRTTFSRIEANDHNGLATQRLAATLDENADYSKEFNLGDLLAYVAAPVGDVLWAIGQEGKICILIEFAVHCANALTGERTQFLQEIQKSLWAISQDASDDRLAAPSASVMAHYAAKLYEWADKPVLKEKLIELLKGEES